MDAIQLSQLKAAVDSSVGALRRASIARSSALPDSLSTVGASLRNVYNVVDATAAASVTLQPKLFHPEAPNLLSTQRTTRPASETVDKDAAAATTSLVHAATVQYDKLAQELLQRIG